MAQEITLRDINKKLQTIGLNVLLSAEDANKLLQQVKRNDFLEAIQRSERGDQQTKVWLSTIFNNFGFVSRPNPESYNTSSSSSQSPQPPAKDPSAQQDNSAESYSSDEDDNLSANRTYLSCHVYAKSALCFSADETRKGIATIALDAASSTAPRQYNWSDKVRIQFTSKELPVAAAVMLGFNKKCEFKNHGPENNKGFSLEDQGDKVFCRVFTKGASHSVPISKEDRFHVGALMMRQLSIAFADLDHVSLISLLRVVR